MHDEPDTTDTRHDEATRKRLDEIGAHYELFSKKVSRILWALVALILTGALIFTGLLNQNSDRITAEQALADSIQSNRVAQCNANNTRHKNTVKALHRLEQHVPAHERIVAHILGGPTIVLTYAPAAQSKQSEASTLGLINAIAPLHNCKALSGPHTAVRAHAPKHAPKR